MDKMDKRPPKHGLAAVGSALAIASLQPLHRVGHRFVAFAPETGAGLGGYHGAALAIDGAASGDNSFGTDKTTASAIDTTTGVAG